MRINTEQIRTSHRKVSNQLIVINAALIAILIVLVNWLFSTIRYHPTHPIYYILCDLGCISSIMLIGGIYLKGCYRYIWTQVEYNKYRIFISAILPLIWFTYLVLSEYTSPTMDGPQTWMVRDNYAWFGCWRLNWIMTFVQSALDRSILMIYTVVIIRWMYKYVARHRNCSK